MNMLNQKMLELNTYMDGRFQTVVSGFGLKRKKKKDFNFEEEDFFDPEYVAEN